jgi:ribosomal protein S18 acetylase RimI-like enzyme
MAPKRFVLRMRRELAGPIEGPQWPRGVSCRTLTKNNAEKDAKAAHAVLAAGFWEGGGGAPMFRQWWSQLRKDSEFDPLLFFLAVDGEGVAGLAQCWTSAFVKDLAVHPRMRRLGVGRALMLTAFHTLAARGAFRVELKVREENLDAQRLYHDIGMRIVGREPG